MKQLSQPYHLLGLFGLLIFLLSLSFNNTSTLDFHIHDTVFIISIPQVLKTLTALLLFFWLIYTFTIQILFSKAVMWIHIISMLLFTFYVAALSSNIQNTGQTRYSNWASFERISDTNSITRIFILLFLVGQLLFLFNIVAGLIKRKIK